MKACRILVPIRKEPKIGDMLIYTLRFGGPELPKNTYEFKGTIKTILVDMDSIEQWRYYIVLPESHPECEEFVYPAQVRGYLRSE